MTGVIRWDIIGTNLLTKFHEDLIINVASRVLTSKNDMPLATMKDAPLLGSHFFQANIIILELIQDIIETNLLTKFHEDWSINVASRVLTSQTSIKTIFELIQDIIGTNLLTNHIWKNAPPPGSHVFQPTGIIFELVQDIIGTKLLTQFHEDWTINVASRAIYSHIRKNAPPLGSHVTISELIQDISGTNVQSKFPEDRKINVASRVKNAPPPDGHVFAPTDFIFKLVQDIIKMNLLTKFFEDRTINVASRVTNAPPLGSHFFSANVTIFELIQNIIETNLLTKFHEDWTINANVDVAQRTTDNVRRTTDKGDHKSSP
ncbi:hypothetical protein DPMN_064839 [Dreissena polymorpha]|uniref:Uncharacterized protein n=1 Tax=Dreissena polymorpha TaxID=45954 RepID=A0A9D4CE66_DREPO|nr:hypothetical protein DPMN_064839 [Dreissena polymorpha]